MQKEQGTTKLPTQISLIARLLVGIYLLYTVYSLGDVWNRYAGMELTLYLGAMIVFGVLGLLLTFFAGRDLLRGKYVGGALDAGDTLDAGEAETDSGSNDAEDASDDAEEIK